MICVCLGFVDHVDLWNFLECFDAGFYWWVDLFLLLLFGILVIVLIVGGMNCIDLCLIYY